MSNTESRAMTEGDPVAVSAVVTTSSVTQATAPRVYSSREQVQIQINADLTVFMGVEDWRQLNATVERHIAAHLTEPAAAIA